MIKNIIFDWSGVVRDGVAFQLCVVNKMFKEFNVEAISLKELKENWRQPHMIFYNKYLPDLTPEEEWEMYKKLASECPRSKAFSGITELINRLKKSGKKMAVLSGDLPETFYPELKEFGLENVFVATVVNVYDKSDKIKELMSKNKFDIKKTVFIGDSGHEVEVGRRAGIKTVAVTWGFCTEEKLKLTSPDYLVHNIKELEKILLT